MTQSKQDTFPPLPAFPNWGFRATLAESVTTSLQTDAKYVLEIPAKCKNSQCQKAPLRITMHRRATIAQADITRIVRAVMNLGYDCDIEIRNGIIRIVKPKHLIPAEAAGLDIEHVQEL